MNNFDIIEHFKEYITINEVFDFLNWEAIIYLVAVFILLLIGKKINDWTTPYKIDEQLTGKDNKALAVSFLGYMLAISIIIIGVLSEPWALSSAASSSASGAIDPISEGLNINRRFADMGYELISTFIWSLIGIGLLIIARVINDKLILSKFNNIKEIIEDKNIGTGAVQFGTYIGTAFIIKAVISGETAHWASELISTAVFFILAQAAFIIFGLIYQKITSYDIHEEIEKDNAAAGVGFGLNLAAIGIILSSVIEKSNSLIIFTLWFIEGAILLLLARFLVDKIILPGKKLNNEIKKDRNWGAALIEGGIVVMIAFLLNASFA